MTGGRYIDITIDRDAAARFGMNIADVQSVVSSAVGGENIGETVEGFQRYPINLRYLFTQECANAEAALAASTTTCAIPP